MAIFDVLSWPEEQSAILSNGSSATHAVKLVHEFHLAVELTLRNLLEHLFLVVLLRLFLLFEERAYLTQLLEDSGPQTQIHLIVKLSLDLYEWALVGFQLSYLSGAAHF